MLRNTWCTGNRMWILVTVSLLVLSTAYSGCSFASQPSPQKSAGKELMNINNPTVVMETNKGTIKLQVFKSLVPTTASNFLDLVNRGFYNGLTFHRYEPGFCLQGGDPKGNGGGGFIDPQTNRERTIPLEVTPQLRHDEAGMVAMARTNDPNSASSQFYFTLGPANFLDMQYAVFGKVTDGMSVVQQLRQGDKMVKVSMLESVTK